jgi:hypothetical protein
MDKKVTGEMSLETRKRLIAAADRALKWRRDRIMGWRIILFSWRRALGHEDEWHAYFTCWRHGTNIIAEWVGPYDLGLERDDPQFDPDGPDTLAEYIHRWSDAET